MDRLGLRFRVVPSQAEEVVEGNLHPAELVRRLAAAKANWVIENSRAAALAGQAGPVLVIGADTVVVLEGEILGKPINKEDAVAMLLKLQGRTHEVYTGVAVIPHGWKEAVQPIILHESTRVTMRPFDRATAQRYVETGEPLDKAGAYAVQGLGSVLVKMINGCYFNVVGLPVSRLASVLESFGIRVF
jgi:septum formation protein